MYKMVPYNVMLVIKNKMNVFFYAYIGDIILIEGKELDLTQSFEKSIEFVLYIFTFNEISH